jgi:threonine/homoserine/homoserine lactone efflux protein
LRTGRTACILAITVALAHTIILLFSTAGLGAVLDRNLAALFLMQICGAAYLVYAMLRVASTLWKRQACSVCCWISGDFGVN